MFQVNVDISILICLPTDSIFICTGDGRITIITAYHSSCSVILDVIMLLVNHSVTMTASLQDTVWYLSSRHLLWLRSRLRGKKERGILFVFDRVKFSLKKFMCVNALLYIAKKKKMRTTTDDQTPAKSKQLSAGQCSQWMTASHRYWGFDVS